MAKLWVGLKVSAESNRAQGLAGVQREISVTVPLLFQVLGVVPLPSCILPVPEVNGFGVASVVIPLQVNMFREVPVMAQADVGVVLFMP